MARKRREGPSLTKDPNSIWKKNPEIVRRFLNQMPDYSHLCAEVAYILEKRLREKTIEIATVAVVEKTKAVMRKVNKEKKEKKISYMHYAAPQVALALALVDDKVRRDPLWTEDGLVTILEENALK